jgi:VanZ family protein
MSPADSHGQDDTPRVSSGRETLSMPLRTAPRLHFGIVAIAYAAFVLYGSLLPFSFQWRSLDEAWRIYLGLGNDGGVRLSLTDFATNVVLFLPLAFFWTGSLRLGKVRSGAVWFVIVGCGALSAGIEFAQVFVPPRTSSIYDLVANVIGAIAGIITWEWLGEYARTAAVSATEAYVVPDGLHRRLRRLAIIAAAPYVLALTVASGWFSGPRITAQEALVRLGDVSLLPFHEHQMANIALALASSVWQCALYLPLGFGVRLIARAPLLTRRGLFMVGACGCALAALMEAGKLFVAGRRPDIGDLVIGSLAAIIGFVLWPAVVRVMRVVRAGNLAPDAPRTPPPAAAAAEARLLPRAAALGLAAGVMLAVAGFPFMPIVLAIGLAAYAIALLRWPWIWLWVVPATLPVLDLAPLSGWFFFDEFDFIVVTTLAVSVWNGRWRLGSELRLDARSWMAILFLTSVLVSTLLGLWPLQAIDWNAFSSYYSHYNALRVAKGFLWAFALTPLLLSNLRDGVSVPRHFTAGVVAGLAGVTMLALWERYAYPGLFDFSRDFRVGTFFSSMHNGGSHIEAYLVMALPFLVAGAYFTRSWLIRIAIGALFIAATYVLMVTFSRGAYLAYALSLTVLIIAFTRILVLRARWASLAALYGTIAASLIVASPILLGNFAQQRIGASFDDLGVRVSHWEDALQLVNPGLATQAFGMGLGRYPESYFYRNREGKRPATFRYESEKGNQYLKLGSGERLYVEQIVSVAPAHVYRLSVDVRSSGQPAALNVIVCERTYFHSYGCESATIDNISTAGQWEHHETTLNSGRLGSGTWLARRPVKLSLEDPNAGSWVDVDNLALVDEDGTNVVANGDFSRGNAHWFFSAFDHWPWHIENLWVALLFEQGWFGVLAFAALVFSVPIKLLRMTYRGDPFSGAALAAMLGFLCVGLFASLFEAPRLATLFFLTLLASGAVFSSTRRPMTAPTAQPVQPGPREDAQEAIVESLPSPLQGLGGDSKVGAAERARIGMLPPKSAVFQSLIAVALIALLVAVVTRSPLVPYNLRDLPNPAHPYAAPVILAVFFVWVFAAPAWMAQWFSQGKIAVLMFPVAVVLHGVLAWQIVRYGAYPVMIHKVTGTPILGWPWEWETLARFTVLEGTLFLLLTGGCMVACINIGRAGIRQLILWLGWAVLLLPIAHYVIVSNAATDNLTELMADGGSAAASLALGAWIMTVGGSASMLAICAATHWQRATTRLPLIALSIPLCFGLLSHGMEAALVKYDAVLSGMQFLLSTDRAHYATGWELWLRYFVFHSVLLCGVALVQYPLWVVAHREK